MSIGPVEYVLIAFPGNQFKGEIVPALADLIDAGTVRIIDLVFLKKDADGTVTTFEYDGLEDSAAFAELPGEAGGFLGEEDIAAAGDALEPDFSAALLVWEDVWAAPLAEAIRGAGGVIIGGERVPHEIVEAALEEFAAQS
ncbi:conserved hypothetical protein [Beutenbergia cavernae DSM 12333]|uniref:DUF1269 domain-containing protein n=1 Tax=Beutenbergia cavernae (strain ATCC BAA-8 / DSM 12333 / CCUG 43141 / JCM 11478 / NBRC 16432 / NCIMB 13614 / HKI 0122) TaxID=471853 RepID=C5BYN9_BEUC1|nr:DUF6325 family protein [Beutenbergia cavernae]ACQ78997.1 conserved hypothetical protein [Beutenbergia cavernae DSM 12333]